MAFISFLIITKIRSLKNSAGESTKETLPKTSKNVNIQSAEERKKKNNDTESVYYVNSQSCEERKNKNDDTEKGYYVIN